MSLKTAIDAFETAIVTGTTGNTSDLISVLRTLEADRIPVFDTRADAEAADVGPHSAIIVLSWSSSSLLAPTVYERVGQDPLHMSGLRCADRLLTDLSTTDATNGGYFLPSMRHTAQIVTPQLGALGQETDDIEAIQGCVDLVLYGDLFGGSSPWYNGERLGFVTQYGESLISRPIQLNYGYDVRGGLIFQGTGMDRRAEGNSKASAIIADFATVSGVTAGDEDNQPCVFINAARRIDVRGIWFEGPKSGFAALDKDDPDFMLEATFDAIGGSNDDRRYNPSAAVVIDGRIGTQPSGAGGSAGGPYPDQSATFPSWLPATSYYGVAASSHCNVYQCGGRYFDAFHAVTPGATDANGDFCKAWQNEYSHCKYGFAHNNSQGRLNSIRDNVGAMTFAHYTNKAYGPRAGKAIAEIAGNQFAQCAYMLHISTTAQLSTPSIGANYGEDIKRIALVAPASSNEIALSMHNCEFSFNHSDASGVPGQLVDVEDIETTQTLFRFVDCIFRGGPSVYHMGARNVEMVRCRMDAEDRKSTTPDAYAAFGGQTLGNFLHDLTSGKPIRPQSLIFDKRDQDSLATILTDTEFTEAHAAQVITRSSAALTMWQHEAIYPGVPAAPKVGLYHPLPQFHDRSFFTAITRSDKDVTFTLASDPGDGPAQLYGLMPGGVLLHRESGSVLFVKSKSTTTVVAELQTNYVSDGAGGFNTLRPLVESISATITGATQANPVVVSGTNTFANGDIVEITGVSGMTQLNNNYYKVNNVTGSSFQLQDLDGVDIDGTGFSAYTSGGEANPGDIISIPAGRFVTRQPIDITFATSTSPSAAARPDGGTTQLADADNGIQAGDLIVFPDAIEPDYHLISGTTAEQLVTAVTASSITFTGTNPRANGTARIGVVLRDPPANV